MLAAGAAGVLLWPRQNAGAARAAPEPRVPVTVATVARQDVPIYRAALGTVQAFNTVTVRTQLDGPLQSINFKEGQEVHRGDTLAVIDPRPLQASLDQTTAKKAEDEAQLVAARKDLARFKELATRQSGTQQSVDQQQGKVDQLIATIAADQGAIEAAQTQLSYTTIKAPIDGRVGFRQVDAGNIVHAGDQNPLTVLTQIRPAVIVFTLPQRDLTPVREAMLRGPVVVQAFDQDNVRQLAEGTLLLIDNQIDQTTGTIRLKASFPNDDERLWPGEFVRIRIRVDTRTNVVTVPPAVVQRNGDGLYAWVVTVGGTAEQRPIATTPVDSGPTIVDRGLEGGEHVVVNGQSRLQPGSPVEAKPDTPTTAAADAS